MSNHPPTLLCLCASHVCSPVQAQKFEYLLASISKQTTKAFKFFIGISFENDDLKQRVVEQLNKNNDHDTIHTLLFSKRQSQFQRYSAIMKALGDKGHVTPETQSSTYICFTDDDDLWSPHRMKVYRSGAERLHADKRKPKYMFTVKHFKYHIETRNFTRWAQLPTDANNFSTANHPREYCDLLCTHALVAQWFTVASPELLRHLLCDVVFTKWVVTTATIKDDRQVVTFLRMNCNLPLYYYRQAERKDADWPGVFLGFNFVPEVKDRAMAVLMSMRLTFWHQDLKMTPPDDFLIDKVATMIEQGEHPSFLNDQDTTSERERLREYHEYARDRPLWQHVFVELLGQEK